MLTIEDEAFQPLFLSLCIQATAELTTLIFCTSDSHLRSVLRNSTKMISLLNLALGALCRPLLARLLLDQEERLLMEAASFVIAKGRLLLFVGVEYIPEHQQGLLCY